jgi:predicted dehydrogenase
VSGPLGRPPRIGFLGVGWIGRARLEAVARSGIAEVAAIADADQPRARQAALLAPGAQVAAGLDELLELDLDGVAIATPSALHAEQARAALERGLAVFCQKPLARNADEAQAVVNAARHADRLLAVDLSYRFTDGMRRIKDEVARGALGRVFAVEAVFHNAHGPEPAWFYDRQRSGGGCLADLGVHLVDLALWTLGHPDVVSVSGRLLAGGEPLGGDEHAVEDYASVHLDLANGASVQLSCSWRLNAGRDAVIGIAFYGTAGGAALRNVEGSFYDFRAWGFSRTLRRALCEPPDAWPARAILDGAARLRAGRRFDPEAERLVQVSRVLDAVYAVGGAPAVSPELVKGALA